MQDESLHHMRNPFRDGYHHALFDARKALQSARNITPEQLLVHLKATQRAADLDLLQSNSRFSIAQKGLDEDHAWRLGFQALITLCARTVHESS